MVMAFVLVATLGCVSPSAVAHAQQSSSAAPLPTVLKPLEIEMQLTYEGHGGCFKRCIRYRVTVRGDGFVQYDDLGGEPREPSQWRLVSMDETLAIVNELLQAGVTDAPVALERRPLLWRDDEFVKLGFQGGGDEDWNIILRLGSWTKALKLEGGSPLPFIRVRDQIVRIGGPNAWRPK